MAFRASKYLLFIIQVKEVIKTPCEHTSPLLLNVIKFSSEKLKKSQSAQQDGTENRSLLRSAQ